MLVTRNYCAGDATYRVVLLTYKDCARGGGGGGGVVLLGRT